MTTFMITGANRGIGFEMTRILASQGHRVLACCRRPNDSTSLQALASKDETDITIYKLDVTSSQSIAQCKDLVGTQTIDCLVNNAGIIGPERQSTLDMDFEGWAYTFAVNTMAPLAMAQTFLPNIKQAEQGRILNISTIMASFTASSGTDRVAYRSSKTALNKAMQCLARDLVGAGIVVTSAHPGWVRTEMGGTQADISSEDSAAHLCTLIKGLSMAHSGKYLNYDGSELPW